MRNAAIGAAMVMTGKVMTPEARAQQAAKEAAARSTGPALNSSSMSSDLDVVKRSKGPVMTILEECGGELPAMLVMDAVTRLLPGALGNEASALNESCSVDGTLPAAAHNIASLNPAEQNDGGKLLLDYPHYTRPAEFRGWAVPEILIGGNHAEVAKWRRQAALEKTKRNRPDLLSRG